jgi:purine-binding chemotaxis protein CheW
VNATDPRHSTTASELRRAFDRSFSTVRRAQTARLEDFLAVRLGRDSYAIRLAEISGLVSDKAITLLPGRLPAFIGIAGFRGAIVPVFDLALLLGCPMADKPRWLVTAAREPVAFAFAGFEGHLRLSPDAIARQEEAGDRLRPYVRETARTPERTRSIVDMASVVEAIQRQVPVNPVQKER